MSDTPQQPAPKPAPKQTSSSGGSNKARVVVGEDSTDVEFETNGDPILEGDVGKDVSVPGSDTRSIVSPQSEPSTEPVEDLFSPDYDPGPRAL